MRINNVDRSWWLLASISSDSKFLSLHILRMSSSGSKEWMKGIKGINASQTFHCWICVQNRCSWMEAEDSRYGSLLRHVFLYVNRVVAWLRCHVLSMTGMQLGANSSLTLLEGLYHIPHDLGVSWLSICCHIFRATWVQSGRFWQNIVDRSHGSINCCAWSRPFTASWPGRGLKWWEELEGNKQRRNDGRSFTLSSGSHDFRYLVPCRNRRMS